MGRVIGRGLGLGINDLVKACQTYAPYSHQLLKYNRHYRICRYNLLQTTQKQDFSLQTSIYIPPLLANEL